MAQIFDDFMLKVLQINLESFKGVVELNGFVDSTQASAKAVEIANSLKGVKAVTKALL